MRDVCVEHSEYEASGDCWVVIVDNDWIATFRKKEDADQWAEIERQA